MQNRTPTIPGASGMSPCSATETGVSTPSTGPSGFYVDAMALLDRHEIPALVGGAYAFAHHSGLSRETKDLDLFLRPADFTRALTLFHQRGFRTDVPYPHWLGKVYCGDE